MAQRGQDSPLLYMLCTLKGRLRYPALPFKKSELLET